MRLAVLIGQINHTCELRSAPPIFANATTAGEDLRFMQHATKMEHFPPNLCGLSAKRVHHTKGWALFVDDLVARAGAVASSDGIRLELFERS